MQNIIFISYSIIFATYIDHIQDEPLDLSCKHKNESKYEDNGSFITRKSSHKQKRKLECDDTLNAGLHLNGNMSNTKVSTYTPLIYKPTIFTAQFKYTNTEPTSLYNFAQNSNVHNMFIYIPSDKITEYQESLISQPKEIYSKTLLPIKSEIEYSRPNTTETCTNISSQNIKVINPSNHCGVFISNESNQQAFNVPLLVLNNKNCAQGCDMTYEKYSKYQVCKYKTIRTGLIYQPITIYDEYKNTLKTRKTLLKHIRHHVKQYKNEVLFGKFQNNIIGNIENLLQEFKSFSDANTESLRHDSYDKIYNRSVISNEYIKRILIIIKNIKMQFGKQYNRKCNPEIMFRYFILNAESYIKEIKHINGIIIEYLEKYYVKSKF